MHQVIITTIFTVKHWHQAKSVKKSQTRNITEMDMISLIVTCDIQQEPSTTTNCLDNGRKEIGYITDTEQIKRDTVTSHSFRVHIKRRGKANKQVKISLKDLLFSSIIILSCSNTAQLQCLSYISSKLFLLLSRHAAI